MIDPLLVRRLRMSYGLSRKKFGQLAYVAERTVASWELGEREIPEGLWELLNFKIIGTQPYIDPDIQQKMEEFRHELGRD